VSIKRDAVCGPPRGREGEDGVQRTTNFEQVGDVGREESLHSEEVIHRLVAEFPVDEEPDAILLGWDPVLAVEVANVSLSPWNLTRCVEVVRSEVLGVD
jgi:hypothetical protein